MYLPNRQRNQYVVNCPDPEGGCLEVYESSCIAYTGTDLPWLGVTSGDDIEYVLRRIENALSGVFQGTDLFPIKNIGIGAKLWAGLSPELEGQVRSIRGADFITVTEGTSEVTIGIDPIALSTWLGSQNPASVPAPPQMRMMVVEEPPEEPTEESNQEVTELQGQVDMLLTVVVELQSEIKKLTRANSGVSRRLGSIERMRFFVEDGDLKLKDKNNFVLAEVPINEILGIINRNPIWENTGQLVLSSSPDRFVPNPNGTYLYKQQIDTNPESATYNMRRWIRQN